MYTSVLLLGFACLLEYIMYVALLFACLLCRNMKGVGGGGVYVHFL